MECERVGRGKGTWIYGGGNDAMDGGGGCSTVKDVAPLSCGSLLTLERELV